MKIKYACIVERIYEGRSLISAVSLITLSVSALWQFALYQIKAGSFPSRQIPNTLIYYAKRFENTAVIIHLT